MLQELSPTNSIPPAPQPFTFNRFVVRRRVAIMLCAVIGIGTMLAVRQFDPPHNMLDWNNPWTVLGFVLVGTGLLIRSWAAAILQKGRVLATEGPYSACRHPLYAGSSLMVLGFSVLLGDPWTTLALLLVMCVTYPATVNHEEKLISGRFNLQWPGYAGSTPRLFPPRFPTGLGPVTFRQWVVNREYQAVMATTLGVVGIQAWRWYCE